MADYWYVDDRPAAADDELTHEWRCMEDKSGKKVMMTDDRCIEVIVI